MSKLFGLLAMGLAVAGCAADGSTTPTITTSAQPILGGINTTAGEFPDVVAVEVGNGSALCTGSLVAPDLVLTAAHCVSPNELGVATQQEVTAGISVHLDATGVWGTGDPGVAYGASNSAYDPLFNQPGNPDLGLIWLGVPVTDRDPLPINYDAASAPIGVTVTMVGYGISPTPTGTAGRENVLFNKSSSDCQSFGNLSVDNALFLCFDETTGTGTCSGDSGGPALAMINNTQTIVGVTSFGDQGCTYMGAHMRTDAGKAWLQSEAPELGCTADGTCNTACGMNGLPQDPDCPVCATDADCGTDMVCGPDHLCEPAPLTPGGLGSECGAGHTACVVGQCANGPDGQRCSESCSTASDCGDGFDCLSGGSGGGACWPSGAGGGGCSVGGRTDASGVLLLLGAALLLRRRRR